MLLPHYASGGRPDSSLSGRPASHYRLLPGSELDDTHLLPSLLDRLRVTSAEEPSRVRYRDIREVGEVGGRSQ